MGALLDKVLEDVPAQQMQPIVKMEFGTAPIPPRPRPTRREIITNQIAERTIPIAIGEVAPIKRVDAYNTVKDDQGNSVFNFWKG